MYIGKTYDRAKSMAEFRQWKRRARRDFLKGVVHEFRNGEAGQDGETVVMEVTYRKKKKRTKPDNVFGPFGIIGLRLADRPEMTVDDLRSISEVRSRIYSNGHDPLTGKNLKKIKSFEFYTQKMDDKGNVISMEEKRVPKALDEYKTSQESNTEGDPYGSKRNNVIPDLKVYKMLMDRIEAELEK